jgi:hypothetical protein
VTMVCFSRDGRRYFLCGGSLDFREVAEFLYCACEIE